MPSESTNPLDVLRDVWQGNGQSKEDLDAACGPKKICKNMVDVGFGGFVDETADGKSAWRATLERDGKLNPNARGTIREMVLGSQENA